MFNCQLGSNYNPTKNYGFSNWFVSPKLDGVRGLYLPERGLVSRTLKTKYVGLEHIETICSQMAPGFVIDGELYIPGERFDRISGIVRDSLRDSSASRKNYDPVQKQRVQFHVFALWKEDYSFVNTELMIESIGEEIPDNQSIVIPVKYERIENTAIAIQTQTQLYKESGASQEGAMLRHPEVAYSQGREAKLSR